MKNKNKQSKPQPQPQPVKEEQDVIEMTPDTELELSNGKEEGEE